MTEFDVLLAMDSSMPGGLKVVLFVLIAFLLVILGVLACLAFVIRRRPSPANKTEEPETVDVGAHFVEEMPLMHSVSLGSAEGVAVAMSSPAQSCPTCRREYEGDLEFCPNDARRLIPSSEMLDRSRTGGSVCPRCQRAFDPGVRFCPHDASELVPVSIYEITQGAKREASPTGVLAKICPQCRKRYDLAATFCGKDGSELKTVN